VMVPPASTTVVETERHHHRDGYSDGYGA